MKTNIYKHTSDFYNRKIGNHATCPTCGQYFRDKEKATFILEIGECHICDKLRLDIYTE